jgi:energy-coupling factor transport system substrate-specific component
MAEQAVRPSNAAPAPERSTRWRTVDIVVTAVLGVAFGVVFWAWGLLWAALDAPFSAFPPAQAVMYGVWLLPAVLAPLIVRKAGAALFAELLAAIVSALLGSAWGTLVLLQGLLQGLGGEVGFAAFGYRRYGWPQALLAALGAGTAAALFDLVNYYPDWAGNWQLTYVVLVAASTMVIAGLGGLSLRRSLAASGALSAFSSSGRTRV